MLTFDVLLTLSIFLLFLSGLFYIILHRRFIHEHNLTIQPIVKHATMTDYKYIDQEFSPAVEADFMTDDRTFIRFFIDEKELSISKSGHEGMLSYQGDEFKGFEVDI